MASTIVIGHPVLRVTNPDAEDPEPTPLAVRRREAMELLRNTVTGDPSHDIRRIVLYGIAIGMFAFAAPLAAIVGSVCLVLLLATDPGL